jgi:hypothetical protein
MTDRTQRLRRDYTPAFLAHLNRRSEASLQSAYELGRSALADGFSPLELVHVHHQVFADVARTVREVDELPEILEGASTFLVEAMAPFEMTRPARGDERDD